MFIRTTAINKILSLKKRKKVIPGGTSAGKTYGILPVLIDKATKEGNLEISVVSESIPHLRKGALKDFLKIMKETGRYVDAHYNKTLLTYTFSNNSYIEFFSVDQESKVRGPRRNILYVNECNNISFETYYQLSIRTNGDIYLDFNPSHSFWAYDELKDDEEVEWLTLTYKDNEGLHENIVKELEAIKGKAYFDVHGDIYEKNNIKNAFWDNQWKVYVLGLLGVMEEVIFSNWKIIDNIPSDARYEVSGLDYGFTNDPSACIDRYNHNGAKIYDEVIYEKGLINSEIANRLKSDGIRRIIIGDSSEPKSNQELKLYGLNIMGAIKGADSVNFGIQLLQKQTLFITKRSTNLINELRKYCWLKDRDGKITNTPIVHYNHCIDAMRYMESHNIMMPRLRIKKSTIN